MGTSQDARIALRTLRRKPAFAVTAIITLALGIGATTAIYSFLKALLLDPLPFPEARSLVLVSKDNPNFGFERMWPASAEWERWRARGRELEGFTGFAFDEPHLLLDDTAHRLRAAKVRPRFLDLIGRAPTLGRDFATTEYEDGASPVAILSHALWQERFGGREDILGQRIRLDDGEVEIVGVLPTEPAIPAYDVDLILPLPLTGADREDRQSGSYMLGLGRLRPGADVESARTELAALMGEIEGEQPSGMDGWAPRVETLPDRVVGSARRPVQLLFFAVLAVLLIACANITNLLLARAHGRTQELAIRFSVGATRGRILRQLMTENLVLALLGGVLGAALSVVLVRSLVALAPSNLPRLESIGIDGAVLAFSLVLTLLTSLVFGLLPAWGASRRPRATRDAGDTVAGKRFREVLVVGQVALAIVLLIGSGLFVRSLLGLLEVEPGFETEETLLAGIEIPAYRYPDAAEQNRLVETLVDDVASAPRVASATASNWTPMTGSWSQSKVDVEGHTAPPDEDTFAYIRLVTPGYFATMGVPLFEGRDFMASDRIAAAATEATTAGTATEGRVSEERPDGVAIVNRRMVDRFWPDGNALGSRFRIGGDESPWLRIIGVAGDERQLALRDEPSPGFYVPYGRNEQAVRSFQLIVRVSGPTAGLESFLREHLAARHPFVPIVSVRHLRAVVDTHLARPRFLLTVLSMLAGLALTLAAIGLYGVIAYSVAQRTHEFGVRSALGADPRSLLWLVMRRGAILVGLGVTLGSALALGSTRFAETLLYNVSALDPATFVAVGIGTALIAMLAVAWPARGAARVDPVKTLRDDC